MTVCHFRQCLQGGDLFSEVEGKCVIIRLDKSLVCVRNYWLIFAPLCPFLIVCFCEVCMRCTYFEQMRTRLHAWYVGGTRFVQALLIFIAK